MEDFTGRKYNRWTIISFAEKRGKRFYWNCLCDCGKEKVVRADQIKDGNSQSCGCLRAERSYRTHGMYNTKIYRVWGAMISRVTNPNDPAWPYYGGIGCGLDQEDWRQFENFYRDMGENYKEGLTLEREDPKLGYSKDNCVWDTWKVQSFNKKMDKRNKSGRTGVKFIEKSARWNARIGFEGKDISLGYFDTFEEACDARAAGEMKYFGRTKE